MLKVVIGYPSAAEEFVVVERQTAAAEVAQKVLDPDQLKAYQRAVDAVYVDPAVIQYAVTLTGATRRPADAGQPDLARYITFGASPRASINLVRAGKALAYLRGRDYVLPIDVRDLARDVLRHRLVLSYEALADNVTSDDLLAPLVDAVTLPQLVMHERARTTAYASAGPGDTSSTPPTSQPTWHQQP